MEALVCHDEEFKECTEEPGDSEGAFGLIGIFFFNYYYYYFFFRFPLLPYITRCLLQSGSNSCVDECLRLWMEIGWMEKGSITKMRKGLFLPKHLTALLKRLMQSNTLRHWTWAKEVVATVVYNTCYTSSHLGMMKGNWTDWEAECVGLETSLIATTNNRWINTHKFGNFTLTAMHIFCLHNLAV